MEVIYGDFLFEVRCNARRTLLKAGLKHDFFSFFCHAPEAHLDERFPK